MGHPGYQAPRRPPGHPGTGRAYRRGDSFRYRRRSLMRAKQRSARPGLDRPFAVGILVALVAAGVGMAVALVRGMHEMTAASGIGLVSMYVVLLAVVLVGATALRRRNQRLVRAEDE